MAGTLSTWLACRLADDPPRGWRGRVEAQVIHDRQLASVLGFAPQADVWLEREDGSARLWIELEISRADPVANHAKFAVRHLFEPFGEREVFVSMVSSHVQRGRRNLGSSAVTLLRHVGLRAFQTALLPSRGPDEIKRLNHLPLNALAREAIDVPAEFARALAVAMPVFSHGVSRIHLVGEHLEVSLNVLRWNDEVGREPGRSLWGRRAVKYFVHDPISGLFAPSKFAAFLAVVPGEGQVAHMARMNVALYATLDESEPKFDGHVARRHLVERLAMTETRGPDESELWRAFDTWAMRNREVLTVRSDGPTILSPPSWYAG